MEKEEIRREFWERLKTAEKVLIGIGKEWDTGSGKSRDEVKAAAESLKKVTGGKDCYVITTLSGDALDALGPFAGHMAAPLDVSLTEEQWDAYMKWLSFTLNRNTLLLELGEDFSHPSLIRFPFEKTAMLNQKAFLFRVNQKFCQIPETLKGKAVSVPEDSAAFAAGLLEEQG